MSVSKDYLHNCKSDAQASLFSSPSDMHDPQHRVIEEELADGVFRSEIGGAMELYGGLFVSSIRAMR